MQEEVGRTQRSASNVHYPSQADTGLSRIIENQGSLQHKRVARNPHPPPLLTIPRRGFSEKVPPIVPLGVVLLGILMSIFGTYSKGIRRSSRTQQSGAPLDVWIVRGMSIPGGSLNFSVSTGVLFAVNCITRGRGSPQDLLPLLTHPSYQDPSYPIYRGQLLPSCAILYDTQHLPQHLPVVTLICWISSLASFAHLCCGLCFTYIFLVVYSFVCSRLRHISRGQTLAHQARS